ncbi:GNAT family N-acetyltransferase [Caballeronia sp. LP006]|jgi:ribosomal protein S18 acetylase RimI-like enzyme|uniref:GNAT family N-acetyltransferase n=1 Tax=unclassified Caballeronia TaxID=2646786 RepID=UPI002029623B|nr:MULTISPECIES: GNAT family N-acetyltransferase [unclassified Caballeronia]MDR5774703.1 GNAT family N-acetyltransferase [Caballeronia sp. LZ002]MDR5828162.1 GNAT family N-acetyltransferase [Caballeronia sp. LP006]MDR5850139.1 GNAT family N-acetyltransferase [Caballeronia sp. LZ003]
MNPRIVIRHLDTPADWTRAFSVMKQLRPHLTDATAFCTQLRAQHEQGYRLIAASDADTVLGLAGYRTQMNLIYGRFVYVDDLVVTNELQRSGIGASLLDAVRNIARESDCAHFVLDTGLHMALAQRFYYRNGLLARGMHFVETLNDTTEQTR